MAAQKKTKKKRTSSKKAVRKKAMPTKNRSTKRAIVKKKSANKKPAPKKVALGAKTGAKKTKRAKAVSASPRRVREKGPTVVAFPRVRPGARSAGQSGDLQGLSSVEVADSESVDELLEEGNAFEADVVAGVEDAGNRGAKEVRTHEVPEDDVPAEYLEKD
jgi:hypothetical protein